MDRRKFNEAKSDYIVFTRSRDEFATRFTLNNKLVERKYFIKIVGVWLEDDLSWSKNTQKGLCQVEYAH